MLKEFIKSEISPLLKSHGFKKNKMTWNKTIGGFVQVIDFQVSRFNAQDFTINIGVFSLDIWQTCWQKEPPKFVKEEDCFPRLRVGKLVNNFSPKSPDMWWDYSKCEYAELSNEITTLLEVECIPFLNSLLSKQKINDFYSSIDMELTPIEMVYLAIVKHSIDDLESSINLLISVEKISKAWSDRVDTVRNAMLS